MRTPVLCFIVVPLSFVLNLYRTLRTMYRGIRGVVDTAGHAERVEEVVQQVAEWDASGRTKTMRTARPNWAAMSTKLDLLLRWICESRHPPDVCVPP